MTDFAEKLRRYCRKCRSKLVAPAALKQRAFCCRSCYGQFFRRRCVVCECEVPAGPANRKTCRKAICRAEYRRFRHLYDWPQSAPMGRIARNVERPSEKLDSMRVKSPVKNDRPSHSRISGWQWHRLPGEDDDWELRNRNGDMVAKVRQEGASYWLARPRCIPEPPLESLSAAKLRAEEIALCAFSAPWPERKRRPLHGGMTASRSQAIKPLDVLDGFKSPDALTIAEQENKPAQAAQHSRGSGAESSQNQAARDIGSDGQFDISDDLEIPEFLRRTQPGGDGIG